MKNHFLFILFILLSISCKKDDDTPEPVVVDKKIEINDPEVTALTVEGDEVTITWDHPGEDVINFELWIDKKLFRNPSKSVSEVLRYDKSYSGKVIANYPEGKQAITTFYFHTEKSKIMFIVAKSTLKAINLYNKKVLWEYPGLASWQIHGPPLIVNDLVVFGNESVIACNILTGKKIWETIPKTLNGFKTHFGCVADETTMFLLDVYDQTTHLYGFDLLDGKSIFQSKIIGGRMTTADYLYLASSGLYAYNKSGDLKWAFPLETGSPGVSNYISVQPAIHDSDLFFSDVCGKIYSIDAITGKKNWSISHPSFDKSVTDPTIYDSNLIITGLNNMYSINTSNGDINWMFTHPHYRALIYSAPFVYEDNIVFGVSMDSFGSVVVLNAGTGELIWETVLDEIVDNPPIVFEDQVFVGSNGKLYQMDINNGLVQWTMDEILVNHNAPVVVVGNGEEVIYPTSSGNVQ